ncbi:MAG: methylated-DNA--[protein]-cysteine S-methyltransferase [Chitinophagaceae bacterium]|nr:methylated-DNA--[protein]-cysteine S-methyltransferase [Chitinophagaceae bacterium]
MILYTKHIETPIGRLFAAANEQGIFIIDFVERNGGIDKIKQRVVKNHQAILVPKTHKNLVILEQQLHEYFEKKRQRFELNLQFSGTDFQQSVFKNLLEIPFSKTRSYQQFAKQMNMPLAVRAIAKANGENCLAIVVPCHRVIAANGLLTGYSGGLAAKKYLITLEQIGSNTMIQSALF